MKTVPLISPANPARISAFRDARATEPYAHATFRSLEELARRWKLGTGAIPPEREEKRDVPLFSRGRCDGYRKKANVSTPLLTCLDVDGYEDPLEEVSERLALFGIDHAGMTTHSHGDESRKDHDPARPHHFRIFTDHLARSWEESEAITRRLLELALLPETRESWQTPCFFFPAVHPDRRHLYRSVAVLAGGSIPLEVEVPPPAPPPRDEPGLADDEEPADPEEVRSALGAIDPTDYHGWIRVGQALHHAGRHRGLGGALALWDGWSSTASNYAGSEGCGDKWRSFGRPGGRPVTLGSVFRMARDAGWRRPRAGAEEDLAEVVEGYRVGDAAVELRDKDAKGAIGSDPALVPVLAGRSPGFERDKDGRMHKSLRNAIRAVLVLDLDPRYDEMGDRIMMLGPGYEALKRAFPLLPREVEDFTLDAVTWALAARTRPRIAAFPEKVLRRAFDVVAHHRAFNPVVDWLQGLEWDGTPRIDSWLVDYCGAPDTPYVRAVGSILLRGAVARAFAPSTKYDYLVILEGRTGILKSSLVQALGGEYAREGLRDLRSKDVVDDLRGAWIVELDELEVTRREDVQTLKSFLSRTADRARLAYGRRARTYPRRFVLVGTTNEAQYLRDDTGNRRFLPVRVDREIDLSDVRRDREQLFAEAVERWEGDPRAETLVLPRELWPVAAEEQEERRVADPWEERLGKWVDLEDQRGEKGFQAGELLEKCLGVSWAGQTKHARERVGKAMRRLGWRPGSYRTGGEKRNGFVRPLPDLDEECRTLNRAARRRGR